LTSELFILVNKIKNKKKYHTFSTVPKSNQKIIETTLIHVKHTHMTDQVVYSIIRIVT